MGGGGIFWTPPHQRHTGTLLQRAVNHVTVALAFKSVVWLCALGTCLSLSEPQFTPGEVAGRAGLRVT